MCKEKKPRKMGDALHWDSKDENNVQGRPGQVGLPGAKWAPSENKLKIFKKF